MKEATPVVISKVSVNNIFDKAAERPAVAAFEKALARALKGSKSFEMKSTAKSGFNISPAIEKLTFDKKEAKLDVQIRVTLATLPKRSMFCAVPGKGAIKGVDPKRIVGDITALLDAIATKAGKDSLRELEKKLAA